MKKKFILIISVTFFLGMSSHLLSKENHQMQLTKKAGEVQTRQAQNSKWLDAKVRSYLNQGDVLKTSLDSYAELALNPENRFRLKEDSEVEIDKVLEDSKDSTGSVIKLVHFNLKSGTLLAKLDNLPKGVKLSVGSPTAVAGATGTEFTVVVESQGETHVAVLESQVRVTSINNPNKTVLVERFQKVDVAPWKVAILKDKGTGILSERILGKKFVQESKQNILFIGSGTGSDQEKAHLEALRNLTDRVLDIEISPEVKLGELLEEDVGATERVFRVLANAKVIGSKTLPNGSIEEEVQVNLTAVAQALGRPITTVRQTIRPVSLAEYGAKFGPLARVTTRRAAQIDAYRKLAQRIYGAVIDSQTTVKDFETKNDQVVTVVQGIVQGAEIVREIYFSDGSVTVQVQAPGLQVKNNLTQIIGDVLGANYMSSPTRIIVADFESYKELENL